MVPRTWNGGQLFNIVEHGLHHYLHHLLFHVDVDVFVKLMEDREDDVETFSEDKVGPLCCTSWLASWILTLRSLTL